MKKRNNKEIRKIVFDKYSGRCAYCGCKMKIDNFSIDHIIPIYRNCENISCERGANTIDNFNPCCKSCNSSKSTFTIEQWRNEIKLKISRVNRDNSNYRLLKRMGLIKEVKTTIVFYFEKEGSINNE